MQVPEKRPVRELFRFLTSWEMLVVQGISVALVMFAPDDVLTQYPMLGEFVDSMETWIPSVADYRSRSDFPQVAGMYFSVMFVVTPIILFYSPKMKNLVFMHGEIDYATRPIRFLIASVVFFALCIFVPPFFYCWNHAQEEFFTLFPVKSSKFSLAVLGWFSAGGGAWAIISHTIWIPIFAVKKIFFKK
jgi:hypothetical protein